MSTKPTEQPVFPEDEQLIRVSVAAKHLAVSKAKIYGMMDSGALPYVKLGKSRRIARGVLNDLIATSTVGRSVAAK